MENFITRVTRSHRTVRKKIGKIATPSESDPSKTNNIHAEAAEDRIAETLMNTFPATDPQPGIKRTATHYENGNIRFLIENLRGESDALNQLFQQRRAAMSNILKRLMEGIEPGTSKTSQEFAHEIKVMREHMNEKQIDEALENTFPASDPPSWY